MSISIIGAVALVLGAIVCGAVIVAGIGLLIWALTKKRKA